MRVGALACGVWRVARGVHHDNDTVTIAEHGPVLSDVGDNPEARGCVLRDRGCTRLDTDQEEGALHDARQVSPGIDNKALPARC